MEKKERLQKAVEYVKYSNGIKTNKDLAVNILKTDKGALSSAINGNEKFLNDTFLKKFAEKFPEINADWLISGEGEMIKNAGDNVINSIGDHNSNTVNGAGNATTLDKAMDEIAAQRRLTEKSQQQIDRLLTIIESMNSK